jgi:hypothetical protein
MPAVLCLQGPFGASGSIAYNVYLNMFQPQHTAVWGDTVLVYMPKKETGVECLEVRGVSRGL